MNITIKRLVLLVIGVFALIGANFARDVPYQAHATLIFLIAAAMFIWTMRVQRALPQGLAGSVQIVTEKPLLRQGGRK